MGAWKSSLRASGQAPLMAVVDSAPESVALALEDRWIAYYRSRGAICNVLGRQATPEPTARELAALLRRMRRSKAALGAERMRQIDAFLAAL